MKRLDKYVGDVLSGKVAAGEFVKLACERHLKDISNQGKSWFPYSFDRKHAGEMVNVFEKLNHWKGQWAGQSITLEPSQVFSIASVYGWRSDDGKRRFTSSFKSVARKNAKTTEAAGKAIIHVLFDGVEGAQVWAGATKEEQARIVVNDAGKIIEKTPVIKSYFRLFKNRGNINRIYVPSTSSFIAPLGGDSDTQDGFDPSWGIVDEYHAHKTDGIRNIIASGMGARPEPFIDYITTAGYNKEGPCYSNLRKSSIEVLRGTKTDERMFVLLYELDEDDDWEDRKNWRKSNPLLGVSVMEDYMEDRFRKAKNEGGTTEVDFLTKNLNIWTDSASTWIPHDVWMSNTKGLSLEDMRGRPCYGGLDLASTRDTNALTLYWPGEPECFMTWYFVPEETIQERLKKESVNYLEWVKGGWVITTPGNVTDDNTIIAKILELTQPYDLQILAYDRWRATNVILALIDAGMKTQEWGQGYKDMCVPVEEVEKMAFRREIEHFGNPATAWQIGNVMITRDPAGSMKIDKAKSTDRVDGPVSIAMAKGVSMGGREVKAGITFIDLDDEDTDDDTGL